MTAASVNRLQTALFFFFALFIFASTFSIALAQTALGLALVTFIVTIIRDRYNPFVRNLRWFYLAYSKQIILKNLIQINKAYFDFSGISLSKKR